MIENYLAYARKGKREWETQFLSCGSLDHYLVVPKVRGLRKCVGNVDRAEERSVIRMSEVKVLNGIES